VKKIERQQWLEKTRRLNESNTLKVGDEVVDIDKNKGIVVKIVKGISLDEHGVVYVWQSERYEYGSDNCEHYCEFTWKDTLRII
jgi:DNA-directed RNA polymerase subunit F